jgi:hypothetical protein
MSKGVEYILPDQAEGTHPDGLQVRISVGGPLVRHFRRWVEVQPVPARDLKGRAENLGSHEFRHGVRCSFAKRFDAAGWLVARSKLSLRLLRALRETEDLESGWQQGQIKRSHGLQVSPLGYLRCLFWPGWSCGGKRNGFQTSGAERRERAWVRQRRELIGRWQH